MRDLAKIIFYFAVAAAVAITILSDPDSVVGAVLLVGVMIFLYLFPTCVAAHRRHNNEAAIFALNFFLGWTLLGWVIALVWALTDNTSA
jgi:Superinfection immunity protein